MADVRDNRTREELLQALQDAEEERDALRQVLAIWDALVVALQDRQQGGPHPLPCHMAARLV
mgnify:CR=1 FL=1